MWASTVYTSVVMESGIEDRERFAVNMLSANQKSLSCKQYFLKLEKYFYGLSYQENSNDDTAR